MNFDQFFLAGINYKKTDAGVRGLFAINNEQYHTSFLLAPSFNVTEFFIVSTCNRTEIYGFADNVSQLIDLLCTQTKNSKEVFEEFAYVKNGMKAVEHLFNVAAGLDSQILGDYEIIGQIKQAVKFSQEHGFIKIFSERLVNNILQASKSIKNFTALSSGTVSVSFAAIQYIKEKFSSVSDKKILLIGTGKIGKNTCKNLVDYLDTKKITLINRSEDKAFSFAKEMGLSSASYKNIEKEIEEADIIIVATNAAEPIISKDSLKNSNEKLLIDLSIPNNIEAAANELPQITLVNVDDLAKINDATLQKRKAEIPKAKKIIAEQIDEFVDWHTMRKHVPALKAVKKTLNNINTINNPEAVDKVVKNMAVKMRSQQQPGCNYIEAINDFLENHTN